MADAFLDLLDNSVGVPKERKLIEDETVIPASISNISSDLALKISRINLDKQKNLRSDVIVPSGGMINMAVAHQDAIHEHISKDQVSAMRSQVLCSTRPKNQWTGPSKREPSLEESRAFARSLASTVNGNGPIEVRTGADHAKSSSSSSTIDDVASDSFPSPPEIRRPIKGVQTDSDKYSDYSSASSHKSPSPPQGSPHSDYTASRSDYSFSSSSPYHRPSDLYRTAPAEVYRGILESPSPQPSIASSGGGAKKIPPPPPKKTVTIAPDTKVIHLPAEKKTPTPVFHGGLRSQNRSANFNPLKMPVDTSGYVWTASGSTAKQPPPKPPHTGTLHTSRPPSHLPIIDDPALRGVVRVVVPVEKNRGRVIDTGDRIEEEDILDDSNDSVAEMRRRKWRQLSEAVEEEEEQWSRKSTSSLQSTSSTVVPSSSRPALSSPAMPRGPIVVPAHAPAAAVVGDCTACRGRVLSTEPTITSERQLYHAKCFVCSVCKRSLRDRQHVVARGKLFCEEDYTYTGRNDTTEKCAKCAHPIVDMVLQALGRYYHPTCFRCTACRCCLDGVPFALDTKGEVYCMADYHELFAPRCASCTLPILPDAVSGETVRVVAINNDYHVDCYVCEGCNTKLTDDSSSKCYPLGKHLLCYNCHMLWRKTGGAAQPITDL